MLARIADWHGEMAAACYQRWSRTNDESDLRDYARHAYISKQMWKALRK